MSATTIQLRALLDCYDQVQRLGHEKVCEVLADVISDEAKKLKEKHVLVTAGQVYDVTELALRYKNDRSKKVEFIKELRSATGCSLLEGKNFTERFPAHAISYV